MTLPSTTPQGYCLPRTLVPPTSITQLLPITENGNAALSSRSCCLNSSSSSLSHSGN